MNGRINWRTVLEAFATGGLSLLRNERAVCPYCNGMTGYTVPSCGGRTFVRCSECKGTGKETRR